MANKLKYEDYANAAKRLNCDVAAIRAVTEVESNGGGFDKTGRLIIRFEPHKFHQYTKGKYAQKYPAISFPVRKQGYPTSLDHSWQLYDVAKGLDLAAARLSTSFGMFQIMGSNYASCGCKTLNQFISRMGQSEGEQLDMFCSLILDWGLDDELRNHQWAIFARVYNGPGFRTNFYDTKLARAHEKYSIFI